MDAAFLDNTNNPTLRTPAFTLVDLRATIPLERAIPYGRPQLRIQVDNLLDEDRAWPSGYSYLYATRDAAGAETLFGAPYYYPLATRSIFVGVDFAMPRKAERSLQCVP